MTVKVDLKEVLSRVYEKYLPLMQGKVADYIPELSKADPSQFGISLVTAAGQVYEIGNTQQKFTIQSMSKPFVYALALEDHGRDFLHARVGVEPTGDAFNSIIELEEKSHRPYNPMINSGAIAVTGLLKGQTPEERLARILGLFSRSLGHPVEVDQAVFISERTTGHRNRAIAYLMRNFGVIGDDLDSVLDLYFQQCSILTDCRDLATLAATLACGGVQPITREPVISPERVRDLLTLMFTCGMYDAAGEWAFTVGIPAKSGVSGGIFGVVPGRMGVAVFSPPLDERGHSVRGIKVFQELSSLLGLSIFGGG